MSEETSEARQARHWYDKHFFGKDNLVAYAKVIAEKKTN